MAVHTSTDLDAPRIAGLGIMVSREGATTTIALDGEWDLAQRENVRYASEAPSRARRTEWCLISTV